MSVKDIFGQGGVMSRAMPGYQPRQPQIQMAQVVEDTVESGGVALIEAGTGTGKSLAYLIPPILTGRRLLVSTANKTLQSQLIDKDLPMVRAMLERYMGRSLTFAVAKGKGNYVCPLRAVKAAGKGVVVPWAVSAAGGDLDFAPPTFPRHLVNADEGCVGKTCAIKGKGKCPYYNAKVKRWSANVVVTNHALLCQHLYTPEARILGDAETLVIDEAHQLEAYARGVGAEELSTTSGGASLLKFAAPIRDLVNELARLAVRGGKGRDSDLLIPADLELPQGAALADAIMASSGGDYLPSESLFEGLDDDDTPDQGTDEDMEARAEAVKAKGIAERVRHMTERTQKGWVRHVVTEDGTPTAILEAVTAHEWLSKLAVRYGSVIATSATLTTATGFTLVASQLGLSLETTKQLQVGSPFDFSKSRLYVPKAHGMPDANKDPEGYRLHLRRQMYRLVAASKGGALLLFTSWANLTDVADYLRKELGHLYPVRTQKDGSKDELLAWFRGRKDAVLCATESFREGVDIPGDALRLVAMDKIPYAVPTPVETERQALAGTRAVAFQNLVLPEAIVKVKQGFGRLIRTMDDWGVVAILDRRTWASVPGGQVLESLPEMPVLTNIAEVDSYFADRLTERTTESDAADDFALIARYDAAHAANDAREAAYASFDGLLAARVSGGA